MSYQLTVFIEMFHYKFSIAMLVYLVLTRGLFTLFWVAVSKSFSSLIPYSRKFLFLLLA